MNRFFIVLVMIPLFLNAQNYAPPAGQSGTTAIHKDSSDFVGWATGIEVYRGYLDISDKDYEINGNNRASFGDPDFALGAATGNVGNCVSLGDSGYAIVTFEYPIMNGPGHDFAVFENGFSDDFLEFAHVEVSSDGENFVRFPSHSELQTMTQTNGFGSTDTRYIHNLAGKYRVGYGTPFDLEDLIDSSGINLNYITHVKIVDVVGSIGTEGTEDAYGNKINDPFTTPFESGGFDLEAVGVIHQTLNTISYEKELTWRIYPNPVEEVAFVELDHSTIASLKIVDFSGKLVDKKLFQASKIKLNLSHLQAGYYLLIVQDLEGINYQRTIIVN
jgi:hypothetical protein